MDAKDLIVPGIGAAGAGLWGYHAGGDDPYDTERQKVNRAVMYGLLGGAAGYGAQQVGSGLASSHGGDRKKAIAALLGASAGAIGSNLLTEKTDKMRGAKALLSGLAGGLAGDAATELYRKSLITPHAMDLLNLSAAEIAKKRSESPNTWFWSGLAAGAIPAVLTLAGPLGWGTGAILTGLTSGIAGTAGGIIDEVKSRGSVANMPAEYNKQLTDIVTGLGWDVSGDPK